MDENKVTTIPRVLNVFYTTYAAIPTTGIKTGDLAYATDRLTLYRWSGAAWQAITTYASSGTAANIPNAANLPNGSLYFETDTTILKQVQAGAWASIATPPATPTISTSGTYTGDNGTNRAIAHGLGRAPKGVMIYKQADGAIAILTHDCGYLAYQSAGSQALVDVTDATSTYFYVGNGAVSTGMNTNGDVFKWMAV